MHLKMLQNYLKDQYLLLMIGVLVAPTLLVLIVQVIVFPVMLHSKVDEVNCTMILICHVRSYKEVNGVKVFRKFGF